MSWLFDPEHFELGDGKFPSAQDAVNAILNQLLYKSSWTQELRLADDDANKPVIVTDIASTPNLIEVADDEYPLEKLVSEVEEYVSQLKLTNWPHAVLSIDSFDVVRYIIVELEVVEDA